ncbi:hypothetical protein AR540_18420 [Pseudomonas sp. EpS/L25]|nr:hypothetical protein AR540_18420 [Pseudomonas sp. EpS/L25]
MPVVRTKTVASGQASGEVQAQAGPLDLGVQRQPRLESVLPDQAETEELAVEFARLFVIENAQDGAGLPEGDDGAGHGWARLDTGGAVEGRPDDAPLRDDR